MSKPQEFYLVVNDKNEVFSNTRDLRKLDELNILNIRDYIYKQKDRAQEVLDYILAFKNYKGKRDLTDYVSRSVKKKMELISRGEWSIEKIRINLDVEMV